MALSFSFSFLELCSDDSLNILAKHFIIGTVDVLVAPNRCITKMRGWCFESSLFSGTQELT